MLYTHTYNGPTNSKTQLKYIFQQPKPIEIFQEDFIFYYYFHFLLLFLFKNVFIL